MGENIDSAIRSEFLRKCVEFLDEDKRAYWPHLDSAPFHERITTFGFLKPQKGLPSYDVIRGCWNFIVDRSNEYNTAFELYHDGRLAVCESDDSGVYFSLELTAPDELGEVLDLLEQLTEDKCHVAKRLPTALSAIIEKVFILVPIGKERRLLPFSWATFKQRLPSIFLPLEAAYCNNLELLTTVHYSTWEEWAQRECKLTAEQLPEKLRSDDLLFSPQRGLHSARLFMDDDDRFWDFVPKLVFRLHDNQSRMFFVDFAKHTEEGNALLARVLKNWEQLDHHLISTKVNYPTSKLSQIRLSVELRSAKHAYSQKVKSLMEQREPADKITELYRRRISHINLVHSEYIAEIESIQNPLPFLIEWPLRRYRRSDDPLVRVKYAQQLLNILIKLPLFLSLEELGALSIHKDVVLSIEQEVFSKPLSDGALLALERQLQLFISENAVQLRLFQRLCDRFYQAGHNRAERLVVARNRFHHPPYDYKSLLKAFDEELPSLVQLFREGLRGITFIMPQSQNFTGGKRVVCGRLLMGFESDFPREEFSTSAPFEAFPTGEVVAVSEKKDFALPIKRFLKASPIKTVSIDVGIYDRMVAGNPEFIYVRDLGETIV